MYLKVTCSHLSMCVMMRRGLETWSVWGGWRAGQCHRYYGSVDCVGLQLVKEAWGACTHVLGPCGRACCVRQYVGAVERGACEDHDMMEVVGRCIM